MKRSIEDDGITPPSRIRVVKAPDAYNRRRQQQKSDESTSLREVVIFLAGSIEMGNAPRWQAAMAERLQDKLATVSSSSTANAPQAIDVLVLDPRRDDWDSSWKQDESDPKFNEQVTWELTGMETADVVVFHFAANTISPITLLELGLFGRTKRCVVFCDDTYQRKGNVDIVCTRYNIPRVKSFDAFVNHTVDFIRSVALYLFFYPYFILRRAAQKDLNEYYLCSNV